MSRTQTNPTATKRWFNLAMGSAGLTVLCIAWLLTTSTATASAQDRASARPDVAGLPAIDSIDAQTDITVFLRSGVPARLQLAALRRAWTVDPAIRDFRGLQESDWNFNDPNGVPGFGELGPEVDTKKMAAEIFGETPKLASRAPSGGVLDAALRLLSSVSFSASAHD